MGEYARTQKGCIWEVEEKWLKKKRETRHKNSWVPAAWTPNKVNGVEKSESTNTQKETAPVPQACQWLIPLNAAICIKLAYRNKSNEFVWIT